MICLWQHHLMVAEAAGSTDPAYLLGCRAEAAGVGSFLLLTGALDGWSW